MPLLAIAVVALVIVLSIHVCRTGRSRMWLPVIWVLPVLGSIIYVLVEMLPALVARQEEDDARRAAAGDAGQHDAGRVVDREIDRMLARHAREIDVATVVRDGTVHTRLKLAEECLAGSRFGEAIALFEAARDGFFAKSPDILHGLARAHFGAGDMAETLARLDELSAAHARYQPHGVAILKARAMAKQGDPAAALAILETILVQPENLEGRRLEAQYRRAEILWQNGETPQAMAILTEILRHEQLFRVSDDERQWIRLAGQAMQAIA